MPATTTTAPAAYVYAAGMATAETAEAAADSRSPDVWELAEPVVAAISPQMSPEWVASLLQDLRQNTADDIGYMEDEEEAPTADALEVRTEGWEEGDGTYSYGHQMWEVYAPNAAADARPLAVLVVRRCLLS